jgi:hypothetical protein
MALTRLPTKRVFLKRSSPSAEHMRLRRDEETRAEAGLHGEDNLVGARRRGSCLLFQLPAEIRHEIYRYILPSASKNFCFYTDCDRTIVGTRWNRAHLSHPDPSSLAILRTNRRIYHEAIAVLYSEHLFHFIGFNYLPVLDFIRRLSPEAREMIRKVRLTLLTDPRQQSAGDQPENYELFCKVVHDFLPGLNTLRADPWVWM